LRDATIQACPRPCKTQPIFPPGQGAVMAQMRRIFYGRRKLAILLIGRRSPQCCRRRCTVGPLGGTNSAAGEQFCKNDADF